VASPIDAGLRTYESTIATPIATIRECILRLLQLIRPEPSSVDEYLLLQAQLEGSNDVLSILLLSARGLSSLIGQGNYLSSTRDAGLGSFTPHEVVAE
jgi:hypothetical protein